MRLFESSTNFSSTVLSESTAWAASAMTAQGKGLGLGGLCS